MNLFKNPEILDVAVYFAVDKGVGKLLMAIHKSTDFGKRSYKQIHPQFFHKVIHDLCIILWMIIN